MMPPGTYFSAFPTYPARYSYQGNPANGANEVLNHASLLNPFMINRGWLNSGTTPQPAANYDRMFPIGDIRWQYNPTSLAEMMSSSLAQLAQATFLGNPKLATQTTTHSADLDRGGASPGMYLQQLPYTGAGTLPYVMTPSGFPMGPVTRFNDGATNQCLLPNRFDPALSGAGGPGNDVRPDRSIAGIPINDWRSTLLDKSRIDLNRPLTKFPTPPNDGTRYVPGSADAAWTDRIYLCRDIFDRLMNVTGVAPPNKTTYPPGTPTFEAQRYLAQLAANIVSFISTDDNMIAYNWLCWPNTQVDQTITTFDPDGWVFGTEIPRVVLSEVYGQVQNDLTETAVFNGPTAYQAGGVSDPDTPNSAMARAFPANQAQYVNLKAMNNFIVNFFVELHQPHKYDNPGVTWGEIDPANPNRAGHVRLSFLAPDGLPTPTKSAYRIKLRTDAMGSTVVSRLQAPMNTTGDPDFGGAPAGAVSATIDDFTPGSPTLPGIDVNVVRPAVTGGAGDSDYGGGYGIPAGTPGSYDQNNKGFFVLGPVTGNQPARSMDFANDRAVVMSPPFIPTIQTSKMTTTLTNNTTIMQDMATNPQLYSPTVVLQRLAYPYLPYNNDATSRSYNPFVTVDYVEYIPLKDSVLYDANGPRDGQAGRPQRSPLDQRQSYGRRQPFRATATNLNAQQLPAGSALAFRQSPNVPGNTFFKLNAISDTAAPPAANDTIDSSFDWFAHLDRQLTNIMELLQVSSFPPHLLTHKFVTTATPTNPAGPNDRNQHVAPWFDQNCPPGQSARLHRFFETVGFRDRTTQAPFGGKLYGKVNINTIYDQETLQAICDPNPGNYFDQAAVTNVWNQLQGRGIGAAPTPASRPFTSFATPFAGTTPPPDLQYPLGGGIIPTVLGGTGPFTNNAAPQHPYLQNEILQKIFGNITTRSNVFAVWITTGFFAVEDNSIRPAKLGAEVDVRLRHKFFAVVDRTNLTMDPANSLLQGPRPIFFPLDPVDPVTNNPVTYVPGKNPAGAKTRVPAYSGGLGFMTIRDTIDHNGNEFSSTSGASFTITAGTTLYVDVGDALEAVTVTSVDGTNGTITFMNNFQHYAGCSICTQRLGNPGPQVRNGPIDYTDPRYSDTTVPYRVILK
jgi:hypothetical protein